MYAEDPFRKFLPSTGPLVTYREPTVTAVSGGGDSDGYSEEGGVRVDSGVVEGSEVSMFYDPMISKLIAYGDTRGVALERLGSALDGKEGTLWLFVSSKSFWFPCLIRCASLYGCVAVGTWRCQTSCPRCFWVVLSCWCWWW